MKSLGILPDKPTDTPPVEVAIATPTEPNYPSLNLNAKEGAALELPNGLTVGDTVTLKIKCKVTRVGGYDPTKDGETPPVSLHITHGDVVPDDEEEEPETPEEDADETQEDEEQEVPNSRPKPRVLSPKDSGFGDLND
jgi:hypothetical protein